MKMKKTERIIATSFDEGVNYQDSISKVWTKEDALAWLKRRGAVYYNLSGETFEVKGRQKFIG